MLLTIKILDTGADVLEHICKCGRQANFGIDVDYRRALNCFDKGNIEEGKKLLGEWYCRECWKDIKS